MSTNGTKILILEYRDYEELISLTIDNEEPDVNTDSEPTHTLDNLRSQGWEPMTATTLKIEHGSKVCIYFKKSEKV